MNLFYPDNLPITAHKVSIIDAIIRHQVIVIAGDTGSGKTTQLPKMCLEALPDTPLLIGCTQPRRIAAATVAGRVAEELGEAGEIVGYKIRFHDYTTPATKIKFMTDGVLLAETRQDRRLSRYGVIIIDEAHERSLNIDFLLGYVKQLLVKRRDLKVIITSATIDTSAFSRHFNDAPIIKVSGRTYPVSVLYQPPKEDDVGEKDGGLEHCVETVYELFTQQPRGDILVFLPTERDIRDCCGLLEKKIPQAVILPIFGRLAAGDQRRIFQNFSQVKIVVATNVAETSVTVPGISYVIDSGLARISYYNVKAKTTSLPVTRISRASCDQRKGRCGRIGPGLCIRLYSEEDYNDRPEYTLPEVKRSNLAEVILQMISLKLGDPEKFPFLDPPFKNSIREGYRLLRELDAIDDRKRLTARGRIIADLPIDPAIARIIIEAKDNNCLREIKIISAALAIQDPRIRPADHEKEADTAHARFAHPHSDFMVLLHIWNQFHQAGNTVRSWSKLKKYCKSSFLSFQRMREWIDLHSQLSRIIDARDDFTENVADASYEQIHKSLLAGFLRNLGLKKQGNLYQGTHNKELMIFPGSHQFMRAGQWLVAASFIETSRLYALTVATIEADWVEAVAPHLCKYSWSNPRWQKKTGQVIADEQVSLFGLVLAGNRPVNFGKTDKKNIAVARDIFIQSALVAGQINGSYRFLAHNQALIKKWQEAEEKLRVRDIIADELTLHGFYDLRIPADVFDQTGLKRFLRRSRESSALFMQDGDVLRRRPEEKDLIDFPPTLTIGRLQLRLEYHFEPGSERDGVTFRIPCDFAATIAAEPFEWLVPGLLQEKLTFLLKALPKSIRKNLVPINETVNSLLDDMDQGAGSLYTALENSILKRFKLLVRRSDWTENLPLHLQPRFVLFDDTGKTVCSGRNIRELLDATAVIALPEQQRSLGAAEQKIIDRWDNSTHTNWNFAGLAGPLPSYTPQGEVAGLLYPMLIAEPKQSRVRVGFEKDLKLAEKINKKGTLYLFTLQFKTQAKALRQLVTTTLSGPSSVWLMKLGTTRREVVDKLLDVILLTLFGPIPSGIITQESFAQKIKNVEAVGLYAAGQEICQQIMALVRMRRNAQETLQKIFARQVNALIFPPQKEADFQQHLDDIIPVDLFTDPAPIDVQNIHRQLQGLLVRMERFQANPGKDAGKAAQLEPYLQKAQQLAAKKETLSPEALTQLVRFKELINEYRISLYAPEIKTRESVSAKKLDQQWRATLTKC